jgi:SAM-dependent methyltransferase
MLKSTILDEIGRRHGTDKSSLDHDYLRKYEFFLRPFRDEPLTFLELGVYQGASLRAWAEYLPRARVVGVDIEPRALERAGGRIEVLIGDLSQTAFLESLIPLAPKVVVDDASHWWPDQLRALFVLYPALPPGAVYVVEDVHTSFEPLAPNFSAGLALPPFLFLQRLAEYMTGDDRPAPIVGEGRLEPMTRDPRFDSELRFLADRTDAVVFLSRACLLIRK